MKLWLCATRRTPRGPGVNIRIAAAASAFAAALICIWICGVALVAGAPVTAPVVTRINPHTRQTGVALTNCRARVRVPPLHNAYCLLILLRAARN